MSAHDEQQAELLEGIHDTMQTYEDVGCVAELVSTPERRAALKAGALALRRASPETGWQSIETAPKDGSWFLAWGEDCGHCVYRMGPGFITGEDPQPTHWQPLPTAIQLLARFERALPADLPEVPHA